MGSRIQIIDFIEKPTNIDARWQISTKIDLNLAVSVFINEWTIQHNQKGLKTYIYADSLFSMRADRTLYRFYYERPLSMYAHVCARALCTRERHERLCAMTNWLLPMNDNVIIISCAHVWEEASSSLRHTREKGGDYPICWVTANFQQLSASRVE